MPFNPTTGANLYSPDQVARMTLPLTPETTKDYSAGNVVTIDISRGNPISRIHHRLTGNLVVGTSAATLKDGGAYNLIQKYELIANGDDTVISLPGYTLPYIGRVYNKRGQVNPYASAPAVTTGTNAFVSNFVIPHDVGAYLSLLNPVGLTSLAAKWTCGAASDVATAGGGGGTVALSSVQLETITEAVAGALPGNGKNTGEPGSVTKDYWLHRLTFTEIPVGQTQTDLTLQLSNNRVYSGFMVFAWSDGALSNSILNKASLRVNQTTIRPPKASLLQAMNAYDYGLSSPWTGVYAFDLGNPEHFEQCVVIGGTQRLDLVFDVTHAGTTDKLVIVQDYLVAPL